MKTIDEVREYYSNVFDLLKIHRGRFVHARRLYELKKEFTFDAINKEVYIDDINICDEKINTNALCNHYLSEIFSICDETNYNEVYSSGNNIVNIYDQNIKYLDSKIKEGDYLKRGIAFTANLDYEENFGEFAKNEYKKVKIKK